MIPLLYRDRRAEGNTRLRQCQLVQLHLLYVFDRVCKENGLDYLLEGGTLLGAMRHNGFIPWDDDLDVGMPMRDYKKFLKIADKVLPKDVYLDNPAATKHIDIPFAKLRDAYSFYFEPSDSQKTNDPTGIYIDIFPYEEVPDMPYWLQKLFIKGCGSMWSRTRYFYNRAHGLICGVAFSILGWLCSVVHFMVRCSLRIISCARRGKYCYVILERGDTYRYRKAWMFPPALHEFEDGTFPIPNNADGILEAQYGDWRKLPPEEERFRHATIIDPFCAAVSPRSMVYPGNEISD